MLSDRPYMRGDYEREKTSILTWLLSAIVAGFIVQFVVGSGWFGGGNRVQEFMGLTVRAVQEGRVWVLLTHAFLHSEAFPLHVVFNVLALYFLGRELLPMLGARRFVGLVAVATVVGGLTWTAVHWANPVFEVHIGSTAAIYALFTVFACFFPNQQITFLLFFIFPVTLRPKYLAWFLLGFGLIGTIAYEIQQGSLPLGMVMASSAHLGGMLAGFVYYRFIHDSRWSFGSPDRPEMELPRWLKRNRKASAAPAPTYQVNVEVPAGPSRDNIRAEVDRILDKINSEGFGALTPEEKRILDDAKDLLSRR